MNPITSEDLELLLTRRAGPCVSIYLPTHRAGRETQQDRIRLKNLVRRAESDLERVAIRGSSAEEVLAPARALLGEGPFWSELSDGLGIFLAPGFSHVLRLPASCDELVVVSGAFHVKRLLPLVSGDGAFYVLAISQNRVRLLEGTRFQVEELQATGLPKSLRDALWMDNPEQSLQHHTTLPARDGGSATVMFHGHGGASETEKNRLLRYFRRVDEGVRELIHNDHVPLVLAGVEHYFPIYREANRYAGLVEQGVHGSPDQLTARELHARAWAIVAPRFRRAQETSIERFRDHAGQGKTSDRLEDIVAAAHHGRVDTLFVASGRQCWGAYVPGDGGTVVLHPSYELGDQDLLDVAAAATLKTGGRVFPLAPDEVPAHGCAAAILRY